MVFKIIWHNCFPSLVNVTFQTWQLVVLEQPSSVDNHHFLLFPQCFQKLSSKVVREKSGLCGKDLLCRGTVDVICECVVWAFPRSHFPYKIKPSLGSRVYSMQDLRTGGSWFDSWLPIVFFLAIDKSFWQDSFLSHSCPKFDNVNVEKQAVVCS